MLTPDALTLGVFVTSLVVATVVISSVMGGGGTSRRLKRRLDRVRQLSGPERGRTDPSAPATMRRREARSVLGEAARRLGLLLPRASVLRTRLERAALRLSVVDFVVLCASLAALVAGGLVFAAGLPILLAAAAGLAVGTGLPHHYVNARVRGRTHRFVAAFPDAIDLIVRGVRSGLPVAESMQTAAQEAQGVVAETFKEVTGNLRLGMSLDEALWAASRRLPVQEFKFFVISLAIQQETGGNLAEILANLSQMMRRREQVKLKIKAMSSEARASAMIIGLLPFIMFILIFFVNESYIMKFFIDPRGWLLLAIGLGSMSLGMGVMAKMVRFEI